MGLPPEYVDSIETRLHIQETTRIIERDELRFREKAASELFTEGGYVLFLDENEQFDQVHFVNEMHLGIITFEPDFPEHALTLSYEYGEGIEHGIFIVLTGHGDYRYARET